MPSAAQICGCFRRVRASRSNQAAQPAQSRKYTMAYLARMPSPSATPSTTVQRQSGRCNSLIYASIASAQNNNSGTSVEMMRAENATAVPNP